MIPVLVIVAVLVVAAVGTAVLSRRRAVEQAQIDRERAAIARELSGHQQEQDAIVSRASADASAARAHRVAEQEHEDQARHHAREADVHAGEAAKLEARHLRATGAAERHGERAEYAQRRLDDLAPRR
jgi:hypothetical protein